jgi:hypothetical protein
VLGRASDVSWTNSWFGRFVSRVGRRIRAFDDPTMYAESLRRDEDERRARQERVGAGKPAYRRPGTRQWPWSVGFAVAIVVGGDLLAGAASIDRWIAEILVGVALGVGSGVYGRRKRRIE